MAVLGRILQVIGWVWILAGLFGPVVGLPEGINFFPGIIVLFISRIVRRQARRAGHQSRSGEDDDDAQADEEPRILNTQRQPRPEPERLEPPAPMETVDQPTVDETDDDRDELMERLFLAGNEVAEETASSHLPDEMDDVDRPLSSAEMLARAHRRWDSKRD